ncbi:hypothetical protein SAMN03159443_01935 [Pseudomonas sp. NFACC15-1]|uniref:hypothetical protein n=1 Tax=unclassified Pseudomonas TaxID=196821 RepID=UPI0008827DD0|nr:MULTISPECIES: hypothetical protein [unclassified Pseudomonas]SDA63640.1 hypothetical protein SAMN03159443_01935 [Pseudomonas sp. NFACC15-1]SDX91174.1 hypothetical protein SAMN03159380_03076 [Pseudomonas sp. NFACC14]
MARSKSIPVEALALPVLDGVMLTADQNAMAALHASHSEECDTVNQLLGQAQMAGVFEAFSRTVRTSKLAFVKEKKLYRGLAGRKSPHGAQVLSGTWEEFCGLLGRSVDQVDRDIANLRAFGEEALDSMSRMGIGYRELRQYRRLPQDQQAALIEVAKAGDKEAFVDLAEEMIAKHTQEKDLLGRRLDEMKADYTAQSEVMAKKTGELDKARRELEVSRKRIQAMPADEVAKALRGEVAAIAYEAEASVLGPLREGFAKLEALAVGGEDHRVFKAGLIRQLEITLGSVRSEFNLPDQADGVAWMTPAEA